MSDNGGAGSLPPMSEEQRAEALRLALEARSASKEARARVARGEVDPAEVVLEPEGAYRRMRVRSLLTAVPGVGTVIADRIMGTCSIAPGKRVAGLGSRQRRALAEQIRNVAGRQGGR